MAAVEDRRVDRTKAHDLQDFLVLAVLCGANGWEYIELFAEGGGDYVLARNRGQSPHDKVCDVPAPKGQNEIAEGRAKRRPGYGWDRNKNAPSLKSLEIRLNWDSGSARIVLRANSH